MFSTYLMKRLLHFSTLRFSLVRSRLCDIVLILTQHMYFCSPQAFTVTKMWCYKITSLILGVPCAVIWGIYFACLAFCTSWCCMPCIRSEVSISLSAVFLTFLKVFGIMKEIEKSFKLHWALFCCMIRY